MKILDTKEFISGDLAGSDVGSGKSPGRQPWVLVAGGFHREGGMDRANAELAHYLCEENIPLHLVSYRIDREFEKYANVTIHKLPMVASSFLMSERKLGQYGRLIATKVRRHSPNAHLLANGGNCVLSDINWVHCVHNVWNTHDKGSPAWFRAKNRISKFVDRKRERSALRGVRLVLANSERTRRDLIAILNVPPALIRTVYLGCDDEWKSITPERRAFARSWLNETSERPLVAFVGALGYDNNKGFDTLWAAWQSLCARPSWDANLIVAGDGRALPRWRQLIDNIGLGSRVRMVGFTDRIGDILAAVDILVSPVRYESYGLNVQEAISAGVPAIVSEKAGVAERYPHELSDLLLSNPNDVHELVERLLLWREHIEEWKRRIEPLTQTLRNWTWRDMASQIVEEVERRL